MTPHLATIRLALHEAHKALQLAWSAAQQTGDVELAAYIGDMAADCFSTLAEVNNRMKEAA